MAKTKERKRKNAVKDKNRSTHQRASNVFTTLGPNLESPLSLSLALFWSSRHRLIIRGVRMMMVVVVVVVVAEGAGG